MQHAWCSLLSVQCAIWSFLLIVLGQFSFFPSVFAQLELQRETKHQISTQFCWGSPIWPYCMRILALIYFIEIAASRGPAVSWVCFSIYASYHSIQQWNTDVYLSRKPLPVIETILFVSGKRIQCQFTWEEPLLHKMSDSDILKGALYVCVSNLWRQSCTTSPPSPRPSVTPPSWFLSSNFQKLAVLFVCASVTDI